MLIEWRLQSVCLYLGTWPGQVLANGAARPGRRGSDGALVWRADAERTPATGTELERASGGAQRRTSGGETGKRKCTVDYHCRRSLMRNCLSGARGSEGAAMRVTRQLSTHILKRPKRPKMRSNSKGASTHLQHRTHSTARVGSGELAECPAGGLDQTVRCAASGLGAGLAAGGAAPHAAGGGRQGEAGAAHVACAPTIFIAWYNSGEQSIPMGEVIGTFE